VPQPDMSVCAEASQKLESLEVLNPHVPRFNMQEKSMIRHR